MPDSLGFYFSEVIGRGRLKRGDKEKTNLKFEENEKCVWRKKTEGYLKGTEDPNEIGDHKFVVSIIYGF